MTTILRVRPSPRVSLDFDPDAVYVISDRTPYLEFGYSGRPLTPRRGKKKASRSRGHGVLEKQVEDENDPSGLHWQRWNLAEDLSLHRRLGRHELPLSVPKGITLRCYVIPDKLLSVADFWRMLEDIEAELGVQVAWSLDETGSVQTWAIEDQAANPMMALVIRQIQQELNAARALRRRPPREVGRRPGQLAEVPETALASHWALRRGALLASFHDRLEAELRHYDERLRENMPEGRRLEFQAGRETAKQQLAHVEALGSRVRRELRVAETHRPLRFTPLTQRDHRLRRLLRAFAPPMSELVSRRESRYSTFAPITLNKLFEQWGAVYLARALRAMGFEGRSYAVDRTDGLASCTWRLRRGSVEITVDYEAHPELLDLSSVPALGRRQGTAVEWALAQGPSSEARTLYASAIRCSPDYLLRFEGPQGQALAVGDASVVDPAHVKPKKSKLDVVAKYRRTIHWRTRQGVVNCHPLGAFVLFPGPGEEWIDFRAATSSLDVWLICLTPSEPAPLFTAFIERMVAEVAAPNTAST